MDLNQIKPTDWRKKLEMEYIHEGETLKIFSVAPQAKLIGVTMPVGSLEGYTPDAILVKAFMKNYKSPAKPKVVETYGFKRGHGEPIELINFVFEFIYDRATEAQINRYRTNSKNYESGRYVDYLRHGLTIVFPDDIQSNEEKVEFIMDVVLPDFTRYVDAIKKGAKRQAARRRLGFYVAVESVFNINLRSLIHMAKQRSAELSPNGREAEPQIGSVITQAVKQIEPYIPNYYEVMLEEIGKGYR